MACDRFVRTIEGVVSEACGVHVDSPLAWVEPDGLWQGRRCQGGRAGDLGLCAAHDAALRMMWGVESDRAVA